MDRKRVALWVLYDFANSVYPAVITATVFSVYFARQIVGNQQGAGDLMWGWVMSVSMAFVALSSPVLGQVADRSGVRKKFLAGYTWLCVACVALFSVLEPGMVAAGFVLAVLANVGFEGALVFYNAYLPDLVPRPKRGLVSGLGFGTGYAGSVAGLLMALPLVSRDRFDLTWLAVAAFFGLFSLPALVGLPADRGTGVPVRRAAVEGVREFRRLLRDVWERSNLRRFLLSYFVYVDGVNTTIYFSAIFASTTLGFEQQELVFLYLIVQVSALAGAFLLARPTDVWGPKRVISLTLLVWTGVAVAAFFVQEKTTFFVVAVAAGSMLGAVQAASRALMSDLVPDGKEAEMFGFYAFCGKSSSIIGPAIFGAVSALSGGNQRLAVLVIGSFFLVGLALLQRVRDPRRDGGEAAGPPAPGHA